MTHALTETDFRLLPEDEFPHAPEQAPNFNESVYMNGFDPERRVGGWMRIGNRANEGYAELSVCLYLPDGRIAVQFQRPSIETNDRFEAGGLSYQCLEPFRATEMRFGGEVIVPDSPEALRDPATMFKEAPREQAEVVLSATASSPIHGGVPVSPAVETLYGPDFSRAHFNQHMRVEGSIRVGSEEWPIDGFGWRDHSWGPRFWQAIYAYRLLLGNLGHDRGFMLLKNLQPDGRARRLGVLLVDGEYEEVVDLDITTEWSDTEDPVKIHVAVCTEHRRAQIEGRVLTLAPLRNRRKDGDQVLVSRIAEGFTEYRWDDRVGYGMAEYIERIEDGRAVGYPL
jgi:hypothetical protein